MKSPNISKDNGQTLGFSMIIPPPARQINGITVQAALEVPAPD
jgi:hypothetical protein